MAMPATANPGGIAGVTLGDVAGELIAVRIQKQEFNQTQMALVGNEDPKDSSKSLYQKLDEINETLSKIGIIAAKQLQFITGQASAEDVTADLEALEEAASPGVRQGQLALPGPAGSIQPPTTPSAPETQQEGGMLTSVLKGVRDISLALGGGAALLDIGENIAGFRSDDPQVSRRAGAGLTGQATGGLLGAAGGAKLGATLGTAIGGPLGTLIGGGTGALAGGILGVLLGDEAAKALFDNFEEGFSKVIDDLGKTFDDVTNSLSETWDEVTSSVSDFFSDVTNEDPQAVFDETYADPQPATPRKKTFAEMRAEAGRPKGYDPTTGRPLSGGTGVVSEPGAPTTRPSRARTRSARSQEAAIRKDKMADQQERLTSVAREMGIQNLDNLQGRFELGKVVEVNGMPVPKEISDKYPDPNVRIATKEDVERMRAKGFDFFKDGGTLEPGKMGVVGEGQDGIPGTDDDQAEFVTTSQPVDIIPRHKIKAYNEKRSGMTSAGDRSVLDRFYAEQDLNTGYESMVSTLRARGDTTGDFLPKDKFGKSEFAVKGTGYDIDRSMMETLKEYPDAFQSKMGLVPKLGDFRGSVEGFGGSKNRYLNKEDFMSALEMERDIAELLLNPDNDVGQKLQTGMDKIQSQKETPPIVNAPTSSATVNNTSLSNVSMPMSPKTHDETFTRTNNSNYMFG